MLMFLSTIVLKLVIKRYSSFQKCRMALSNENIDEYLYLLDGEDSDLDCELSDTDDFDVTANNESGPLPAFIEVNNTNSSHANEVNNVSTEDGEDDHAVGLPDHVNAVRNEPGTSGRNNIPGKVGEMFVF